MKRAAVCLLSVLLCACLDEPQRDVQFYLDHPDERIAKMKECRNDPGMRSIEPNCVNAAEAEQRAMFRSDKIPTLR